MTTYSKLESKKLTKKVFSAKGIQVKAYLKENALIRLQKVDSSIDVKDISVLKNTYNSHQASVDKLVEIDTYDELFTIQYDDQL